MDILTQSYGFLLGKVLQRMESKFGESLAPFDIDSKQYGILSFIKEYPYSSQKKIGEKLRIDRTTMVNHIDHLETLGCVERTKNPNDRRAYSLLITEKGNEVLDTCRDFLIDAESEVLSVLNEQEKQAFKEVLMKIWSTL